MIPNISDKIDTLITDKTRLVILLFILITGLFFIGATQISTDSGTSQFTEDIPSAKALENINQEFSTRNLNTGSQASTQLIQERSNVLSKSALLEQALFEREIHNKQSFDVDSTSSIAKQIALALNPNATTPEKRVSVLESATQSQIRTIGRSLLERDSLRSIVSDDYNRQDVSASITISTVIHSNSDSGSSVAGISDSPPIQDIQVDMRKFANDGGFSITVFGVGTQASELSSVTGDSLLIVIPVALILILLFLIVSYRDPIDIIIGLISLLMALVWTFGFLGFANIPFTQMLIIIPPLLLAVGIDFGIHYINRFREEYNKTNSRILSIKESNKQLLVAFGLVTMSTAIGFGSNISSPLEPLRQLGIISAIGIFFTFLIFSIFLPSLKIEIDKLRSSYNIPSFSSKPIGDENSIIGKILRNITLVTISKPMIVIGLIILLSLTGGIYATGINSEFSQDSFLPPETLPSYINYIPVDIQDYETPRTLNLIEENFERFGQQSVTIYISDNMRKDTALEKLHRMNKNSPEIIVRNSDNMVEQQSILSIINSTQFSPKTTKIINKNDVDNNGIPDRNLDKVYSAIESEQPRINNYISDSRGSTRVIYTVKSGVDEDKIISKTNTMIDNSRFNAISTGEVIVFDEVSNFLTESTINGLIISIILTSLFLTVAYKYLNDSVTIGIINIVPVIVAVIMVTATMRYLGIPLNPLTSTTLSISIGIGLDYAIHLTHRIADEIEQYSDIDEALLISVQGTGGALLGSALTTICGIGSLGLALTPVLADFGLIIAIGISYAFLFSIILIPALFAFVSSRTKYIN